MKIAFNPSTVEALIAPPNNKDITFDLRGHNIFARGVKFCGTDTNTWRDIKINNVSIGSNTLDLRDGDNTTLTNINGIVTINSTWRPVVDNLTSDSTTSSLSANQGRVLVELINSKSDSGHNHDDRYLRLTGGWMSGDINFGGDNKIYWGRNSDSASISFKNDGDGDADSYMSFVTSDNGNEYFRWSHSSGSTNTEWMSLRSDGLRVGGTKVSLEGHTHDDRYVKKSGDTMLGALNFANHTWNLVGDDSYMGDCDISGHFGIKAANTTYPGIAFFNNSGTHLGNLTAYSGNIKYGAYSLQFLDNGNTSVSAGTWMNPFSDYNSNAVADGQAICVWGQSSSLSNLAADSGDMSLWLKRVNANVATLNMVLDGEYYANGNQRLAHVSEIPNSLKNPYALTISLNGTSQGPYDGSAAKNINITPSSIGAATSDHNHINYLSANGLISGNIDNIWTHGTYGFGNRSSYTGTLPGNSSYGGFLVLNPNATTTGTYYTTQIALLPGYFGYRIYDDGKWYNWKEVSMVGHNHDGRYVRYYAVTTLDCNNLAVGLTAAGVSATNAAHTNHSAYLYISDVGTPFQIQIPDSSVPYIYKRYYGSGGWSGWFKLNAGYADSAGNADTVDGVHMRWSHNTRDTWIPVLSDGNLDYILKSELVGQYNSASATKLQTARKIWGQSFDGTGDISGSLSGVGHIQFSADQAYDIGSNSAASRYIYTYWLGAKSGQKLELGANNSGYGQGLCIGTNLNVGIGTNSPGYKLTVAGDIYTTTGFKKNGSSDSYVLLGGGGHKLESALNVTYSKYLTGITLTGGNGNKEGYRLIFERTMGGWTINQGVWAIAFRHSGRGTLNIGFDTINSDGSTYTYNIRFLGSTASRESTPFRAFYNTSTKVLRIYWHYYDYTSGEIAVLRGNMEPYNGTWMTSLPNDVGTELAITCNRADQATNSDTVDGYHASSLWRSDGATWNPGANVSLTASANNQEWSFDITRNGHTGCYWHVWDSARSTMLKVNADNGKVYAPYNFVGNLEGNASTATNTQNIRIDQYASTGECPIIWADSASSNANSNTISRLYKTWKYLYWTPNKKTLTLAGNGTKCAIGSAFDTNDRPGLHITGNYPELIMMSQNVSNANHGSTIVLGAYTSNSASETNYRAFAIGMNGPTTNEAFLDFGYGVNQANPHANGIANYGGGSYNNPYIMRLTASKRVFIQGVGDDQKPALQVNSLRNGTWVYTASFLAPNLTSNNNNAIFIGKAHSTCNSFGLTHMHIKDGSASNYAALEVWGVGNVQRWYYDRHSAFLHRADFSSLGSDASYMNSALQIREHGYNGTQADTWANAPRMSWHWSGRVQTQIGLASNNELYLSKNDFGNAYKLVYETGTWGINISGNAASATNADKVNNYHIADESRQVYKNYYTVANPAGAWILIKLPAWNANNEIVAIDGYGDNRQAHCVVHCGSRYQGLWGYQSEYNGIVVTKIRWKEVDSGKFAIVALIDGGITNLSIKSTNSLEISKTTEDNAAFAISSSFFSSSGIFHGNVDWDKIIGKPSSFPANGGNADTVDGEHASNFVRAGVYGQSNLNSLDTYSFIRSVDSAISNTSPNGNTGWYNVIQAVHRNGADDGPNYIGQIALGMTTNINGMFYRTKYNGSWYAWNEVVTTNTGLLRYSRNNVNISSPNCSPIPPSLLEWTIGYPRLYDPEFNESYNNVYVYNNAGNGVVTVTRVHDTNVGNSSSYIIKVVSAAGAIPNYGGWHVATQTELGKVYTCLFRASIPSGVEIEWNSNSIGTGGQMSWLTNNMGTGKWTWYAVQVYCGSGGSTTFYFSAKSPCTWYLSYVNVIENNRASYAGLRSVYSDYLKANASIVFGRNELQYFNQYTSVTAGATNNANPKTDWYHILRMNHANSSGYFVDLAIPFHDNRIQFRRITNSSDNGWRRVITEEPNHNVLLCDSSGGGSVGIGTTSPSYKLDVNGQVRASGFIHSDHSINDAVLLAGGGYERIFKLGTTRYYNDTSYELSFHKLSGLCNNLVWVDGCIWNSTSTSFQLSSDFYPYFYANSPSMLTIYRMDGNNMITVNGNGIVVISCSSYPRRVGFFYTGRA